MKIDTDIVTEKVVVELDSEDVLTVRTPTGSVRFDDETADIIKYLSVIGILSSMLMLDILGGAEFLRDRSKVFAEYVEAYEERSSDN